MKRRHITVPEPEYKRFASATAGSTGISRFSLKSRNRGSRQPPGPHFSPGCERGRGEGWIGKANASPGAQAYLTVRRAPGLPPCCVQRSQSGHLRVRSRDLVRNAGWRPSCGLPAKFRPPERPNGVTPRAVAAPEEIAIGLCVRSDCVANFNHSYLPLPAIQPDWPCHVRLPLQSRHRPGTRRSGRRVRFRAGDGGVRFVRGAGRQPTRGGARVWDVPGIRTRPCRAGGDATEHGPAARPRGNLARTRSPSGRAVWPLVQALRSQRR